MEVLMRVRSSSSSSSTTTPPLQRHEHCDVDGGFGDSIKARSSSSSSTSSSSSSTTPSPLQRHEHGEEVGGAGEAPEDGDDGVEAADLPVGAQGPGDEPQQAEGRVAEEGEEVAAVRHGQAEQAHVDPVP